MNRKSLVAALALIASAGSVLADDITVDTNPFTSTKSRAEVQAELQQHRAAGVNVYADDYNPLASFRSEKSREQVRASVSPRTALPQGELASQPVSAD